MIDRFDQPIVPNKVHIVPLGDGDVNMELYIRTLNDIGTTDSLTIELEIAHDPVRQRADIGAAVKLLESLRAKVG